MEEKKKQLIAEKQKHKELLEKKHNEFLQTKKHGYNSVKNEQIMSKTVAAQFNSHNTNMNNYKYLKIKQVSNILEL